MYVSNDYFIVIYSCMDVDRLCVSLIRGYKLWLEDGVCCYDNWG